MTERKTSCPPPAEETNAPECADVLEPEKVEALLREGQEYGEQVTAGREQLYAVEDRIRNLRLQ